jgi:phosphohistidine phosphatase SixA
MSRKLALARVLLVLALAAAVAGQAAVPHHLRRTAGTPGMVLLIRHAERASAAGDSLLSAAGEQRAACLAQTLRDAGVGAIFATDVQRTQQTAAPLARLLHLETTVVPKADLDGLLKALRTRRAEVALVVGHADTIPRLVEGLGGGAVPPFGDDEYDRLILVPATGGEGTRAVTLRYCTLPPAPAAPAAGH